MVFITSNWIGNKEMMEGCKREGIPAFVSSYGQWKSLYLISLLSRGPCGTFELVGVRLECSSANEEARYRWFLLNSIRDVAPAVNT